MFEQLIKTAIEEAKISLREGNHGFGAVVVKDGAIISQSHDHDVTEKDPTFHAELDAIRKASKKMNGRLDGCTIISTHEPCPMCAGAIVWSDIAEVVYGYGIADSIKEGRKRIDIRCSEIFERANAKIKIVEGVLKDECALLYNEEVRKCIKQLRNIDPDKLKLLSDELTKKRKDWFIKNGSGIIDKNKSALENAYTVFLNKLGINENEAPIVDKRENGIIIHSKNFCPTLEACKILDLDARYICKNLNEKATDLLLKEVNPGLTFSRNYDKLRPYSEHCEEEISIITI